MAESWAGNTVLVTGSAGFLGSHLCHRLVTLGAQVSGADNYQFARKDFGLTSGAEEWRQRKVDLADRDQVRKLFADRHFDTVFHLAAVSDPRTCVADYPLAFRCNVDATFNVLHESAGSEQFVFASSAAVYGSPLKLPISETHPRGGLDPYAVTKIMGEELCNGFARSNNRTVTIARNFNTFGPGQARTYVVPSVVLQGLRNRKVEIRNASPIRDLMYVDNTIDAFLTVARAPSGAVVNIGSGRGIRIGELADLIRRTLGNDVTVTDLNEPVNGSPAYIADNTLLRGLGWREQVAFEEGIRRTIHWFEAS